jgi:hypothetical protein
VKLRNILNIEIIELVVALGLLAIGIFLLCALISTRLVSLYKGGLLEDPWFPVIIGVVLLTLNQVLATLYENFPLFESDSVLLIRVMLMLDGGAFLFLGLYRALKTSKTFHNMAKLILTVRDKEDLEYS